MHSSDVQFDDFVTIINKCTHFFPEYNLILTGGEPFKNDSFFKMLRYACSQVKYITVTSNGSFLFEDTVHLKEYLAKGNVFLQLSLDGDAVLHDAIRGTGAYDSVIRNILELRDYSNRIVISTTVGKDNFQDVLTLAKQLNNYQFHHWKVSPLQLNNPLQIDDEINPSTWNRFVDKLLPLCKFRVHIKKLFDFDLMRRYKNHNLTSSIRNCGFGLNKFYISSDFNVFPCSCVTESVGNILNENLERIYLRLRKIGTIIPKNNSVCSKCEYVNICNGGCPGYSYKCFGSYDMGDIRCPKVRLFYEKYKGSGY